MKFQGGKKVFIELHFQKVIKDLTLFILLIYFCDINMSTQNPFSVYFRNKAFASIEKTHPVELTLHGGHGFYQGLPWQERNGLVSMYHTFMPIVKPFAKVIGQRVVLVLW